MNNIIETITGKGGLAANIYQDKDPSSPREDDNLGRITTVRLCRHRLSDEGEDYLPEDLSGWDAVERYLMRERDAVVILPVFMYEHSVTAISTGSFIGRAQHAAWDSGQVGFIYATRKDILANFMVKKLTRSILDRTKENLEGEIKTFNQYIQGEVYGYQVIQETKCDKCGHTEPECLDSCGGFYGIDYAREEAKSALESAAKS